MQHDVTQRVRERLACDGLDADRETLIALFICSTKAVNLPCFALAGMGPLSGQAMQALTQRLFRDSKAMTALMGVTRWSADPRVFWTNASVVAPLYAEFSRCGVAPASLVAPRPIGVEASALAHAILTTVRLSPILPDELLADGGFGSTVAQVDKENATRLQHGVHQVDALPETVAVTDQAARCQSKSRLVRSVYVKFLDALEEAIA